MFNNLSAPSPRRPSRLSHVQIPRKPSIDPDAVSVYSASSNHSGPSSVFGPSDNYKVTRVGTQQSLDSCLLTQSHYRVTLELSAKEITLLRMSWNHMLVEDQENDPTNTGPDKLGGISKTGLASIPGSLWTEKQELAAPPSVSIRSTIGALSTFCTQLYLNLLTRAPDLEVLFPSLRHQAVSMAGVMSLAINSLENLASLDDYLIELGKRHARILAISPDQFELMGESLIQTFYERFGKRFTNELEVLWIKFYLYLANSLLQFGTDPVLRLGTRDVGSDAKELIFTSDSDSVSVGTRRISTYTDATSVSRSALDEDKKLVGAKPMLKLTKLIVSKSMLKSSVKEVLAPKLKLKRGTKLGRKGECVIV